MAAHVLLPGDRNEVPRATELDQDTSLRRRRLVPQDRACPEFRFVGESGSFTAYREIRHKKQTRCWIAHRSLHGRHAKHQLGVTDRLMTTRMEQMAARLQRDLAVSSPLET